MTHKAFPVSSPVSEALFLYSASWKVYQIYLSEHNRVFFLKNHLSQGSCRRLQALHMLPWSKQTATWIILMSGKLFLPSGSKSMIIMHCLSLPGIVKLPLIGTNRRLWQFQDNRVWQVLIFHYQTYTVVRWSGFTTVPNRKSLKSSHCFIYRRWIPLVLAWSF